MEPECVVCLQLFDGGDHTPRVLSCGHSVCQTCVADLRSHWGAPSRVSSSSKAVAGGLVRCPECQQLTKLPLGGFLDLPKNIELMRLIQGPVVSQSAKVVDAADAERSEKTLPSRRKEGGDATLNGDFAPETDSTLVSSLAEVVHGEPVVWILPQAAVKRRKDMVHGACVGEMVLNSQPKVQEVRLQCLSRIGENRGKELRYQELVRLAWESVQPQNRTKLMRLISLGCRCNYFAEVAGLWMSDEGVLFLVSNVHVEGIKRARSLFFAGIENESPRLRDGTAEGDGGSSSGSETDSDNIGRSSEGELIRLGLELCEILMEVHAAGILLGTLRVDSFSLDAFGHLRLHVGDCVFWTRLAGDAHECVSPEVLEIIKQPEEESCISSALARGSGDEGIVSQKADVWSLGWLVLQLLSGSSLLGGLTYSEAHDVVCGKTPKPEALEKNASVKAQLLNCMAAVPRNRPRVVDVWRELKELLDDRALEIPSHFVDDSSEDSKPDMEVLGPGSLTALAENSWIEPESISEASDGVIAVPDPPQNPTVEQAAPEAPSLSRALIDVIDCDAQVKTVQGHLDQVSCLSIYGSYLISASFDKTVRLWSLNDYRVVHVFKGHEQRITALAVHEASELCVSGDYGGYINVWNVASGDNSSAPLAAWQEHQDWRYSGVASLAISSDELLYSGSGDRTIKAWSTSDFKQVATMEGHTGVVSTLMVEGQILVSGSWDGAIRLWWRPDHSPLADFVGGSSGPVGGIRALVKCPASGLLFSGHDSGVIQIWNEEECVGTFKAHAGVISALAFDQDWLYSSSWDGFVKAWPLQDVLSGSPIPVERKCNRGAVTALCCSGQGQLFVGTTQSIQVHSREAVI